MARRRPQICKVDSNHAEIVNTLRALKWGDGSPAFSVESLAKVANGMPDICVGFAGQNFLFEIKYLETKTARGNLKKAPQPEALTKAEVEWHQSWRGQVAVVTSARQVVEVIMQKVDVMDVPKSALALLLL